MATPTLADQYPLGVPVMALVGLAAFGAGFMGLGDRHSGYKRAADRTLLQALYITDPAAYPDTLMPPAQPWMRDALNERGVPAEMVGHYFGLHAKTPEQQQGAAALCGQTSWVISRKLPEGSELGPSTGEIQATDPE
jgi:hypothetical protein